MEFTLLADTPNCGAHCRCVMVFVADDPIGAFWRFFLEPWQTVPLSRLRLRLLSARDASIY